MNFAPKEFDFESNVSVVDPALISRREERPGVEKKQSCLSSRRLSINYFVFFLSKSSSPL